MQRGEKDEGLGKEKEVMRAVEPGQGGIHDITERERERGRCESVREREREREREEVGQVGTK